MILGNRPRLKIQHGPGSYRVMLQSLLHDADTACEHERGSVEARLASFLNSSHAVHTPNCRSGIYFAVKHFIRPGQDVVMSPYTIADVVNMVIAAGGRPAFADIDNRSCNLAVAALESSLTENTGAVLVTHLHGVAAEIEDISRICKSRSVALVEDVAQAFAATRNGKKLGTFGDAGVFSFGMYKNINTWFGGALVTNDERLATETRNALASQPVQGRKMLLMRLLKGALTDFVTAPLVFDLITRHLFCLGLTRDIRLINRFIETELDCSRVDQLPAHYLHTCRKQQLALLDQQLDTVETGNQQRRSCAELYFECLADVPGLILPRRSEGDVYSVFPIQVSDRYGLLCHLLRQGCDVAAQHLKNCADLDSFSAFAAECPNSRFSAASVILLPTYPGYGQDQATRTIDAIKKWVSRT